MSADLSQLIPELEPFARELVALVGASGLQPRVTSTLRTYPQQKRLYSRFVAGLSQYPAAPPGRSAHEYGYAFDMVVADLSWLPTIGDAWIQAGGVWHDSDPIHFEYPGFVAPEGFAQTTVGTVIRTVAEWLAMLPWYVSILLPFKSSMKNTRVTWERMRQLAYDSFGVELPVNL